MRWLGEKLKTLAEKYEGSQEQFCSKIGVTRAAFNKWCKGENIPNGKYLISICSLLNISVNDLFEETNVCIPQFMVRHNCEMNEAQKSAAKALALEYETLITPELAPAFSLTANLKDNDFNKLAQQFRYFAFSNPIDANSDKVLAYGNVFCLADRLGVCLIFKNFPDELKKIYAFYYPLNGIRVIFVDSEACLADIIFVLLHELCHAVRGPADDPCAEDEFCNKVADLAQFPEPFLVRIESELKEIKTKEGKLQYIEKIADSFSIYGLSVSLQKRLNHDIGISKEIMKECAKKHRLSCVTMRSVLENEKMPDGVVKNYLLFSSLFIKNFVIPNLDSMSDRYLVSIMNLDHVLDAPAIRKALRNLLESGFA